MIFQGGTSEVTAQGYIIPIRHWDQPEVEVIKWTAALVLDRGRVQKALITSVSFLPATLGIKNFKSAVAQSLGVDATIIDFGETI
jgi:hypothetical protein